MDGSVDDRCCCCCQRVETIVVIPVQCEQCPAAASCATVLTSTCLTRSAIRSVRPEGSQQPENEVSAPQAVECVLVNHRLFA